MVAFPYYFHSGLIKANGPASSSLKSSTVEELMGKGLVFNNRLEDLSYTPSGSKARA